MKTLVGLARVASALKLRVGAVTLGDALPFGSPLNLSLNGSNQS